MAGIHDGGRDAFIQEGKDLPNRFCQHSVTKDWKRKIRETVQVLHKNGFKPTELIFCSPRSIQREADELRAELRGKGITLDIRDRSWFEAVANSTPARVAAAERLANKYVDPLLASRQVLAGVSLALTAEEERVAVTYLQLELSKKDPAKGVTKSCIEALITYTLREAEPSRLVKRQEIHDVVIGHMPRSLPDRARQLTDSTLNRLSNGGLIKHHTKEDSFGLSFPYRQEVAGRLQEILVQRGDLLVESAQRVQAIGERLGFDFQFLSEDLAADALCLIEHELCERGRLAALAIAEDGNFFARKRSLEQVGTDLINSPNHPFQSFGDLGKDRWLDVVPAIAEELAQYPTENLIRRLRTASDAYCLQFALQQTEDVQNALNKVISGNHLLVDTSVIIPCMTEILLPIEQRRVTNLLRSASAMGCRLIIGEDVLNEIDTHLDRIQYRYRNRIENIINSVGQKGALYFEPVLVQSFLEAKRNSRFSGSFEEFIELFKGHSTPREDLVEYLKEDLSVSFDEMEEERAKVSEEEIADLYTKWYEHKPRRPGIEDSAFEKLVWHDVRAFLLVERLRKRDTASENRGHRWWWLVQDGNAFRFDIMRHTSGGGRVCMSPDFFARYLSLSPKPAGMSSIARELLPTCLEIAGFGFIPPELREEATKVYEAAKDLPEYRRRRMLRELVNKSFTTREKIEDESNVD